MRIKSFFVEIKTKYGKTNANMQKPYERLRGMFQFDELPCDNLKIMVSFFVSIEDEI